MNYIKIYYVIEYKIRPKNVKEKYKNIWNIFQDSPDLKEIEKYITDIIDENGDIKDDAL